jgi:uncharacterized protein (TIGR02466 family)
MKLKMNSLFPTLIGQGSLPNSNALNTRLLKDILGLQQQDKMGQNWSKENYPGGYTSYGSVSDLHCRYPSFAAFEEAMQSHVNAFGKAQGWNLNECELKMTHLWVNIMPKNTYHTLHLHPHSVVSGAYYVKTPADSVPLKIEDPRMAFYMNAPLRENRTLATENLYHQVAAKAGDFVLFESWVRHEVPPNQSQKPRISLSFNFSLESED